MWLSTFRTSVLALAIGVFLQASGRSAQAQCEVAKPTSPGVCVDDDGSGGGMDEEPCTEPGGTFTGGADCGSVTEFYPSCQIEGEFNCQLGGFAGTQQSDLNIAPHGVASADDFVPAGNQIASVCVWGMYADPNAPDAMPEYSCDNVVEDNFRVRVYTDGGGFPGALVTDGERWAAGSDVVRGDTGSTYYSLTLYAYTLFLDPSITLPEVNVTYWLEVVNNTDTLAGGTDPAENTCNWEWFTVADGNEYSVMGTDDRPQDQGGGIGYVPDSPSARQTDLWFCLGSANGPLDFTAPDTPTGGCCLCDGTCVPDQNLAHCDEYLTGVWRLTDNCETPCAAVTGDWCYDTIVVPGDGLYAFDTTCATPHCIPEIPECSFTIIIDDIWYEYTTTCTGRLVVSMCATGDSDGSYDSVLGLYSDRSGTCSCPSSGATAIGGFKDENCNGIHDGGPGIDTSNIVYPGECWLIRVGGFESYPGMDSGGGLIDIACIPLDCMPSQSPEPDVLPLAGEPVNQKVRYLSFQVSEADAGSQQAMRVTFMDLPAGSRSWNGTKMFVGPPEMYCENAGKKRPPCPPGQPMTEFKAATLQCNAEVREWSAEGVVHVFHEGIVPGGVYHVQAVDKTCELDLDGSYSDPLIVQMSRWGDLVTDCTTCPCGPPDGVVGIPTDVTALLDKFRNLAPPSVPCPAVSKVRADLDWATPNQRVDISDVTFCLDAFRGFEYPFGVADPCP